MIRSRGDLVLNRGQHSVYRADYFTKTLGSVCICCGPHDVIFLIAQRCFRLAIPDTLFMGYTLSLILILSNLLHRRRFASINIYRSSLPKFKSVKIKSVVYLNRPTEKFACWIPIKRCLVGYFKRHTKPNIKIQYLREKYLLL